MVDGSVKFQYMRYLRLLYAYLNTQGEAVFAFHKFAVVDTYVEKDGDPWFDIDNIQSVELDDVAIAILDEFMTNFDNIGYASDVTCRALMYHLMYHKTVLTNGVAMHGEMVIGADVIYASYVSSYGSSCRVYLDVTDGFEYVLHTKPGIKYASIYEILRDFENDASYMEFSAKLTAFPGALPEYVVGSYERLTRISDTHKIRVRNDYGAAVMLDWTPMSALKLCYHQLGEVHRWLTDMYIARVADVQKKMHESVVNKIISTQEAGNSSAKIWSYRTPMLDSVTVDNSAAIWTIVTLKDEPYTVTVGMPVNMISDMVNMLGLKSDACCSAVNDYMVKHAITDIPTEMFRLLALAGINDAEERILTVLNDLGER